MSRDQLLRLLEAAEANPALRHSLRLVDGWSAWLQRVRRLGFAIDLEDLRQAQRLEQAGRFHDRSQIAPIKPLS